MVGGVKSFTFLAVVANLLSRLVLVLCSLHKLYVAYCIQFDCLIKDPCDNEVWQLILQLREIVELVCAPAITAGQVAYLKSSLKSTYITGKSSSLIIP